MKITIQIINFLALGKAIRGKERQKRKGKAEEEGHGKVKEEQKGRRGRERQKRKRKAEEEGNDINTRERADVEGNAE